MPAEAFRDPSERSVSIGDDPRVEDAASVEAERFSPSTADALVLIAQTALSSGPAEKTGGEHQVVVHVDAETLAHDQAGACELEHGPALHPETARRLGCDASVVRILERDGRPLSIGRKTRALSLALRRALRTRDRTCRFPGCGQTAPVHEDTRRGADGPVAAESAA